MDVDHRGRLRAHRRARAPGSAVARDPRSRCRPADLARAQVLPPGRRRRSRDIPVTISRTGYTGDLGYEIWVDAEHARAALGRADRGGHAVRHHPGRDLGARHRAHRGRPIMLDVDYFSAHHALIEAQKSSPLRDQPRLDGERDEGPVQRPRARSRPSARAAPAWGFVGLEVDWDSFERLLRRARAAAAARRTSRGGRARRSTGTARRSATRRAAAGRRCSRSTSRSRTCSAPHFAAGHAGRDRDDGRAPARAGRAPIVRKLPFFDPERKKA